MDYDEGSGSGKSLRHGEKFDEKFDEKFKEKYTEKFVAKQLDRSREFIQQAGFLRMWLDVMKKYASYGVTGTVRLTRLTEEEQEALAGLFAINMRGRSEIRFTLQELDKALTETRFKLTVVESLVLLYGDQVIRNHERSALEKEAWSRFCKWAGTSIYLNELKQWLDLLSQGKAPGYRTFLECYEQFRVKGSSIAWIQAMKALHRLPAPMERLPMFAAQTTGDAHGLDRDQLAGRIFYWGIVAQLSEPGLDLKLDPALENEIVNLAGSEEIRSQYAAQGILLDDMSSLVMLVGWGQFKQHPVVLPLYTIERISQTLPRISVLYIVENPSIFGALIDEWSNRGQAVPFPMLCTSGQPSLAALRLMDYTGKDDTPIYYSGDFDVKGLEMASLLLKRYGKRFVPWFMDANTYDSTIEITGEATDLLVFSERERLLLSRMQLEWDGDLIPRLLEKGRKIFQEHIVDKLLADWQVKEQE